MELLKIATRAPSSVNSQPWEFFIDIGALIQTIALTALEFDLGTCIMRAIVDYPEQVREIVGIADSKHLSLA
jgi:nitroreductase